MSPQCPYKPKRLYTNLKDPDDSRLSKSLACDSFNSIQGHAESTLRPRSKQVPLGNNIQTCMTDIDRTCPYERLSCRHISRHDKMLRFRIIIICHIEKCCYKIVTDCMQLRFMTFRYSSGCYPICYNMN